MVSFGVIVLDVLSKGSSQALLANASASIAFITNIRKEAKIADMPNSLTFFCTS